VSAMYSIFIKLIKTVSAYLLSQLKHSVSNVVLISSVLLDK